MMKLKDEFDREILSRAEGQLDSDFVVAILRTHSKDDDLQFAFEVERKGFSGYPYCLVMDAGDCDLQQIISKEDFSWENVRNMSLRIALAIQHMHRSGHVHGDIKRKLK
jgi:serine/threonine protein kinase